MSDKTILVYIYNSYKDPLFYNLLLVYLRELNTNKEYTFYLITHEQEYYRISSSEQTKITEALALHNIFWYPLKWHAGSSLLIKAYDFFYAFFLVTKLRLRHNIKVIFTFTNIAGAFGFIYSKILKMKFIVFSFEPHCEFLIELGIWKKNSLKYIIFNKLDYLMGKYGDYIITGTKHMVEKLKNENSNAKIFRLPTPIDEDDFYFKADARVSLRKQLGIENKKVFLYIGKFGDLYYKDEIAQLFFLLKNVNATYFFLVVTSNENNEIRTLLEKNGLSDKDYYVTGNLSNQEIKNYLSAADMGISAVPPSPSQKFRSPTKTGEYLCCGLPYITIAGVSEDDDYALEYNVGVVLNSFSETDVKPKLDQIALILAENSMELRQRCRNAGILYRSKHHAIKVFTTVLNDCFRE